MSSSARLLLRFVRTQATRSYSDRELLEKFCRGKDQDAFTELVRRHGNLVLGVCRRVLSDGHLADDAFQATFLLLIRKAHALKQPDRLPAWLYGVALRIALKSRYIRASQMVALPRDYDWAAPIDERAETIRELRPHLDEAIRSLPTKYREPIVLCYLNGMTNAQAALQLGCPAGTIATRLARARDRLRNHLTRRGVVLPAVLLPLLISEAGATSVPAESIINATIAQIDGTISTGGVQLLKGLEQSMILTKCKSVIAAILLVCASGVGLHSYRASASAPPAVPLKGGNAASPVEFQEKPGSDEEKHTPKGTPVVIMKEGEQESAKQSVNLPRGLAPVQATVKLSSDKRFIRVVTPFCSYDVSTYAEGTRVADVKLKERVTTATYNCAAVEVYEVKRKKIDRIDMKRLPLFLKEETIVLVVDNFGPIDPLHLQLIKDGTLLFLVPRKLYPGGPATDSALPAPAAK